MRIDSAAQCSELRASVRGPNGGDVCDSRLARSQGIHTCNGQTTYWALTRERLTRNGVSREAPSRCALLEMAAATQELKNSIQVKLEQSGEYDRCARPPLVERALLSPRSVRRDA